MTTVYAPCAGAVVALGDVPDPVFAGEIVGPGLALDPGTDPLTVLAPIAGRLVKIHPHAFVVLGEDGLGVLVHLGVDTVRLQGSGFDTLVEEGTVVAVGDQVVRWDPAIAAAAGHSTLIPVVALDRPKGSVTTGALEVAAGDRFFEVTRPKA